MKNTILFKIIFLLIIIKNAYLINPINSDEYKLYNKILTNYSKDIRPVKNWNDQLDVKVYISLIKVADVIEDYQSMTLHVKLNLQWVDQYLTWNKTEFNNLGSIVIPSNKIWIPDLHLFNSANNDDRIYPTNVEIFANGTIVTFPLSYLQAHCDFDFSRFPFDTQKCTFLIGTMTDKSKINLHLQAYVEPLKLFPNAEWKYLNFESTEEAVKFSDLQDWSTVKFIMKVERRSTFYVNLFIWPLIFILFLTTCLFILPPTCVERITLGVLLLLSLVVILLMLESYTPKNSFSGVPIIAKLIMFDMVMITFSILISAFIIGINRDNFIVRLIPKWLKNATIGWMSKIACKYETVYATFVAPQNRDEEIEVLDTNQVQQQQEEQNPLLNTQSSNLSELSKIQTLLVLINNQLAMFRMKLQENDLKDINRKEWYLIACVCDRICLIILSIFISIGLIGVFS